MISIRFVWKRPVLKAVDWQVNFDDEPVAMPAAVLLPHEVFHALSTRQEKVRGVG